MATDVRSHSNFYHMSWGYTPLYKPNFKLLRLKFEVLKKKNYYNNIMNRIILQVRVREADVAIIIKYPTTTTTTTTKQQQQQWVLI